ncbi:MAG TPA: cupin domain-containing protein [Noviherbaspirillum sp.]|jgi:mannose-6-phosphate isomerase-like protein (cupin superfamily)|uniref:cupin domain-containing protein n=1 Tax=Noviherbaspirillum sp. TaxID=1926288 RepID=UPI002DDD11C7|nr:cupin domain-containing protein [Noviherbaspirillum sp.]HEV2612261.1 cupin domain-containing protein [Noviherbaspirillum sp.]
MHVLSNQIPGPSGIPGIDHATLAGSAEGLRRISVWQQSVAPGGATPPHRHDCEEVVMCNAGEGELHIGGKVERFGPNTTVVIPANADHQIISVGREPLQFVAVFSMSPVLAHFPDGQSIDLPWKS